jgi:hypothetical protein
MAFTVEAEESEDGRKVTVSFTADVVEIEE